MQSSESRDFRPRLVFDPYVRGADTDFWQGDTANLTVDTVKGSMKVGDTGLVGSASSFSQYLYGDFEFTVSVDSLSPDSNDGASASAGKRWGLLNRGDTLERGAAYFEMRYDTVAGGDTTTTRPLRVVIRSESGAVQRKNIAWDTTWNQARYRILWEADGYSFLVNDTVYATLGDNPDSANGTFQINTTIPQALRLDNRTVDTVDTSAMSVKNVTIRNTRIAFDPRARD